MKRIRLNHISHHPRMVGVIGTELDVDDADANMMLARKGCEIIEDAEDEPVVAKPKRGVRTRLKDVEAIEADALTLTEPVPELVE